MNNQSAQELCSRVIRQVETAIIGKHDLLDMVLCAVLSGGHILFEDYPGLGKTLLAKSLAEALGLQFKRIQFTPDLLPGDITGGYIYNRNSGVFELRKGALFANIVLADEINRASPKTQSALLEAMQEHQITIEGESLTLPKPFFVIATQNPIEYEGTFPLPEAQLDRFMMRLSVGYPTMEEEREIIHRRRDRKQDDILIEPVTGTEELLHAVSSVEDVFMDEDIEKYIITLVRKTRDDNRVTVGASPRGSLALLKLCRAYAAINGRDYVIPDDVKRFVAPALSHRLILSPDLWMRKDAASDILSRIVEQVPVPIRQGNP